jgi:hypothetical protein
VSQWIRQGSNQEITLDVLPQGERVFIQGSNGFVKIKGDVGGTIIVQGSNGMVKIGGVIRSTARVTVQGSNPVLKHHGREPGAIVVMQGSNAEETDRSSRRVTAHPPNQEEWVSTALGKKTLQVQKSNRPRELWGT